MFWTKYIEIEAVFGKGNTVGINNPQYKELGEEIDLFG